MPAVDKENRGGPPPTVKGHNMRPRNSPGLNSLPNNNQTTPTHIDSVVESVENATKRLSQHSQQSNSSKRKVENKIGPWRLGRTLGKGSTGRVRLAKHVKTGMLVAIKIIPKLKDKNVLPYGIEREIIIMKLISHPNIMGLYDVWENDNELYLVLEYVQGGELFEFIINNGKLSEHEAIKYFKMIINGVSYCHKFNICHRDLKPENILMDKDGIIKIADFGMAALETNQRLLETSCGSPHYASPEIVTGKNYHGSPSDVWSCGVILFALLTGHLPFDDKSIRKLLLKVQSGNFHMPQSLSFEAKDLIWSMLRVNPNERIPIDQIMNHPLLLKYPSHQLNTSNDNILEKLQSINMTKPVPDIDSDILHNLQTLWHGTPKSRIILMLKMEGENNEKMFYYLLENYKLNHMGAVPDGGGVSIKKSKSQLITPLPRSTSTIKTVIENEDGEVLKSVVQEFKSPSLKNIGKRKVKPMIASSSKKSFSSSTLSFINMNQRLSSKPDLKSSLSGKSLAPNSKEPSSSTQQSIAPALAAPPPPIVAATVNRKSDLTEFHEFKYLMNSIFDAPREVQGGGKLSKLELLKLDLKSQNPPSIGNLKRVKSSSTRQLSNYLETPNTSIGEYNDSVKHEKHERKDSSDSSYMNLSYSFHQGVPIKLKSPKEEDILRFDQDVSRNSDSIYVDAPSKLSIISELNTPIIDKGETFNTTVAIPPIAETVTTLPARVQPPPPKPIMHQGRETPKKFSTVKPAKSSAPPPPPSVEAGFKDWFWKVCKTIKDGAKLGVEKFKRRGSNLRIKKEYWLENDFVTGEQFVEEIRTNPHFKEFKVKSSFKKGSQTFIELKNYTTKMVIKVDLLDKIGNEYGFGGCFVTLKLIKGSVRTFNGICLTMNDCLQTLGECHNEDICNV